MKKFLAIIVSVILMVSVMPLGGIGTLTAFAANEGYYIYAVSNGEATITGVNSSISGDISIPSTLGGYPVARIDRFVFEKCKYLTSVTIPSSVTSIGEWAFYNCTSLETVYFIGTEEQWNKISIGSYNSDLTNANIVFNCVADHNHTGGTATCKVKAKCSVALHTVRLQVINTVMPPVLLLKPVLYVNRQVARL